MPQSEDSLSHREVQADHGAPEAVVPAVVEAFPEGEDLQVAEVLPGAGKNLL